MAAKRTTFIDGLAIVRDLLAIAAIILAVVYTTVPSSKRLVDETFGIRAWYYEASLELAADGAAHLSHGGSFYHPIWQGPDGEGIPFAISAGDWQGQVETKLKAVVGDIVRRTGASVLAGRSQPDALAPTLTQVTSEATCLRVTDIDVTKTADPNYPDQIWLQLVKVDCL